MTIAKIAFSDSTDVVCAALMAAFTATQSQEQAKTAKNTKIQLDFQRADDPVRV